MADRHPVDLEPIPGILVRVSGDRAASRHLAAEWGGVRGVDRTDGDDGDEARACLEVAFVPQLPGARVHRHKSASWAAAMDEVDDGLGLRIALHGLPRWFGLSLVQGYLVEPALSLLAPRVGGVLLPAAAVIRDGRAVILLGPSGTGKSSLCLRALAAGMAVLGDDQVLVTATGVRRFPRRLRLYSDARRTAPAAYSRLPARYRAALRLRGAIRAATRGYVAPSAAVPAEVLDARPPLASASIATVAILERARDPDRLRLAASDLPTALRSAASVLAAQRRRLLATVGGGWEARVTETEKAERGLLESVMATAEIVSISVPEVPPQHSAQVLGELAAALGLP